MQPMSEIFTHTITVSEGDIDNLNHVNNAVYVKWMDTVATIHWDFLTKKHALDKCIWVVSKHEIEYKREALLNDVITVKTWVGETKGVTTERHIEFYKDNNLLVKTKTIWVLLNSKTFKPTRIRENVLKVLQAIK